MLCFLQPVSENTLKCGFKVTVFLQGI